jgi:hypothetical protein
MQKRLTSKTVAYLLGSTGGAPGRLQTYSRHLALEVVDGPRAETYEPGRLQDASSLL